MGYVRLGIEIEKRAREGENQAAEESILSLLCVSCKQCHYHRHNRLVSHPVYLQTLLILQLTVYLRPTQITAVQILTTGFLQLLVLQSNRRCSLD